MKGRAWVAVPIVLVLAIAGTALALSGGEEPSNVTPVDGVLPSVAAAPQRALLVTAAGDICGLKPATCSPTADLIKTIDPDIALTLGDNQYGEGTLAQYLSGYDGAWGAFKDITYPVAGNHEWKTPAAQGYLDYFGTQDYWYTRTFGDWRFYALDGTCDANGGCGPELPSTSGSRNSSPLMRIDASWPTGISRASRPVRSMVPTKMSPPSGSSWMRRAPIWC